MNPIELVFGYILGTILVILSGIFPGWLAFIIAMPLSAIIMIALAALIIFLIFLLFIFLCCIFDINFNTPPTQYTYPVKDADDDHNESFSPSEHKAFMAQERSKDYSRYRKY